MIERDLATATGRVHQSNLINQFLYFYGFPILETLNSAIAPTHEHNWLSSIVRKHREAFHPIRPLLIMRFLRLSIAEFFRDARTYQSFERGPWLCLNVAAEHYLQPMITDLAISLCCDMKKPAGTFSCSCGFIYCRTEPDETEADCYRIGKIKDVGLVWQQKLRQLVEGERLGLRETARRLKVDSNMVTRYVKRLGPSSRWQRSTTGNEGSEQELATVEIFLGEGSCPDREMRQDLQRQHPDASKTVLRKLAPAVYAWLYRHDRAWLEQNSPSAQRPVAQIRRVNWQERD